MPSFPMFLIHRYAVLWYYNVPSTNISSLILTRLPVYLNTVFNWSVVLVLNCICMHNIHEKFQMYYFLI